MGSPRLLTALLFLLSGACTGVISDPGDATNDTVSSTPGGETAAVGDGTTSSTEPLNCTGSMPVLVPLRLRRLTNLEYQRTVAAVLAVDVPEAADFVSDEKEAGFAANAVAAISDVQLERYVNAGEAVAGRVVLEQPAKLSSCAASDAACSAAWLKGLATRAYRRPPTSDELDQLTTKHAEFVTQWGVADADRMLVETLLLAPQFLYHAPVSEGAPEHALAARLSYFLTSGPPDDELLASVDGLDLFDAEVLTTQARRLLASEAGQAARESFFGQWLNLERLTAGDKDTTVFPDWSPELRASMLEETRRFTEYVVSSKGGVPALLSSTQSFIDEPLAKLYGVSDRYTGSGFQQLELPSDQRAGILTQASFLAGHSHQVETSWVLRGEFIRRRLLCQELPPPPGNVNSSVPNDSSREATPACWGCHVNMDPIGQSFDRYDALGRYGELDADGQPIPTAGDLIDSEGRFDVGGPFDDPVSLAKRLAESRSVSDCVTLSMFRFAHRRREQTDEACELQRLQEDFASNGRDFGELMVAIALSDGFVRRQEAN